MLFAVCSCDGAGNLTKRLLELGCSVNHENVEGKCGLNVAVELDCLDVADALLRAGADVNQMSEGNS